MEEAKNENNHWKHFRDCLIENAMCDYNNIINITRYDCRFHVLLTRDRACHTSVWCDVHTMSGVDH